MATRRSSMGFSLRPWRREMMPILWHPTLEATRSRMVSMGFSLHQRMRMELRKPSDEDISSPLPLSPNDDDDVVAQDKSNEIRIGPMTRARAKLLGQQVNSLLIESDILIDENFILPKSMHLCMIRFVDNTSVARGEEGDWQLE